MCGIAGFLSLQAAPVPHARRLLRVMSGLIAHRGPDGEGYWVSNRQDVGFVHRRLAVIDLSEQAAQPMAADNGLTITYNGEIYNYIELRNAAKQRWRFKSNSDTECILANYAAFGDNCLGDLRGMFAFALWDEGKRRFFAARDRFGIKPFYYAVVAGTLYFASEPKALLPFLPDIATDPDALAEYLTFQYTIGEKTLFRHVHQLLPGQYLVVENGQVRVKRYWDVHYELDWSHDSAHFEQRLRVLLDDSVAMHLRSDVPIGAYISGGFDSSLIATLAQKADPKPRLGFHGRFTDHPGFDESQFAQAAARHAGIALQMLDITAHDFRDRIADVIWHLDFPVAGPGSFPQFMVSELASASVKVVLGGQGGDEIFGGYARYLLAYFEQCIKAAIDGTYKGGNFVVTIESIIPNLGVLREYKPMIKEFWRRGMFEDLDARYFRLINRLSDVTDEVDLGAINTEKVFADFRAIFNNPQNVEKDAYFDKMTHFDFKCLLPALLHVEDRMSMAHGLESRVPFLDHALVAFVATSPANVKFPGGDMKHLLKRAFAEVLPSAVATRRDKMGFPVPLKQWFSGELRDFVNDIFRSQGARSRPYLRPEAVIANLDQAHRFSRKIWGLLSLEIWQQLFHDRAAKIHETAKMAMAVEAGAVGALE